MINRSAVEKVFHFVDRTFWSSARRPFWPASHGGRVIHVKEFQQLLKAEKQKILLALSLLKDPANGLAAKTFLGEQPLAGVNPNAYIANYLYDERGIVHPRFFSEALHVVAANAKALAPHLQKVHFRLLGRENLKRALDAGRVSTLDIGKEFDLFSAKSPEERLVVLEKLGVLHFVPGQSVKSALAGRAFQLNLPAAVAPRPRIERVMPPAAEPAKAPEPKRQLDLFDPERTK